MEEILTALGAKIEVTGSDSPNYTFRLSCKTEEDWNDWLQNFSMLSNTSWNFGKSFPHPVKYSYRRIYVCHHNQIQRRQKTQRPVKIHTGYVLVLAFSSFN